MMLDSPPSLGTHFAETERRMRNLGSRAGFTPKTRFKLKRDTQWCEVGSTPSRRKA